MSKTLFIFRRDLRIQDNTGLIEALKNHDEVLPCFIFDPRQTKGNDYFSEQCFSFMVDCLKDLDKELKDKGSRLYLFQGQAHEVVKKLKAENVYVNRDYTPFSQKRDAEIAKVANLHTCDDILLIKPEQALKEDGDPYTVFTPFWKKNSQQKVPKPQENNHKNYFSGKVAGTVDFPKVDSPFYTGGRKQALEIIKKLKDFEGYKELRNIPALDKTTHLSAHNKFGTVSIRELYFAISKALGPHSDLLRQLYWRDFFTHIAFHFPKVFGKSFHEKYDKIKWLNNKKHFTAWKEGKTGFPIVDAGMRELNETGYMHNRARMIVASFLTKDLHIDWRWGEKYFAQKLVDYDPVVNNGSWQWAASTGCDAQPYFRIFNPWLQQKKFDPDCKYIKKWIPELKDADPSDIHNLFKNPSLFAGDYPAPIVDHKQMSSQAKDMYKSAS